MDLRERLKRLVLTGERTVYQLFPRPQNTFGIRPTYIHRRILVPFDDTETKDEFQDGIYRLARHLADEHGLTTVLDVGCGSAYKLRKYFLDRRCVGLEVPATRDWLQSHYPDGDWRESDWTRPPAEPFDLVICSDVIEHLPNPDALMNFLAKIDFRYLVISTPDRDEAVRTKGAHPSGPPRNPYHLREWNMPEFKEYVLKRFQVLEHRPADNAGQVIVATPRHDPPRDFPLHGTV